MKLIGETRLSSGLSPVETRSALCDVRRPIPHLREPVCSPFSFPKERGRDTFAAWAAAAERKRGKRPSPCVGARLHRAKIVPNAARRVIIAEGTIAILDCRGRGCAECARREMKAIEEYDIAIDRGVYPTILYCTFVWLCGRDRCDLDETGMGTFSDWLGLWKAEKGRSGQELFWSSQR
jgi:hypothetical protein